MPPPYHNLGTFDSIKLYIGLLRWEITVNCIEFKEFLQNWLNIIIGLQKVERIMTFFGWIWITLTRIKSTGVLFLLLSLMLIRNFTTSFWRTRAHFYEKCLLIKRLYCIALCVWKILFNWLFEIVQVMYFFCQTTKVTIILSFLALVEAIFFSIEHVYNGPMEKIFWLIWDSADKL